MIEDIIGLNEAPLPSNHNYKKMGNVLALLKIRKKKKEEIPRIFLLAVKKKSHLSACARWHALSTVLLHCPISAKIKTVDSQSDLRILL